MPIEEKAEEKRYLRLLKNWQLAIGKSAIPLLVLVYIHVFGVDDIVIARSTRG